MERVRTDGDIVPRDGSQLVLGTLRLGAGETGGLGSGDSDALVFVFGGGGELDGLDVGSGSGALVLAGESGRLVAGPEGLSAVRVTVGSDVDLHAPMGKRERVVSVDHVEPGEAMGSRSFQVLFGPHNGSPRATMFVGYVPPGRAPWHYHLYDEIVWIRRGPGRYHVGDAVEELVDGSAFRISPREVHIVENTSVDRELVLVGFFTPAGSPSAAYLMPDVAASYAVAAPS